MMRGRNIAGLLASLVIVFLAAAIGGAATSQTVGTWYQQLNRPAWSPPDWVFSPVWTLLYVLMAVAAWLVWRRCGFRGAGWALGLFLVQLALNAAWPVIFFAMQQITLAAVAIVVLWVAIAVTTALFWRVHRAAAVLLVPYLVWVA